MSVNKIILIGRLGKDPERKETPKGSKYFRFSLATDHRTRDREAKKTTDWHQVVAWGKIGEALAEFLEKGDEVYIEGRMNYWDNNDGHRMADVVVETFSFIHGKKYTGEAPKQEKKETPPEDDESLPF